MTASEQLVILAERLRSLPPNRLTALEGRARTFSQEVADAIADASGDPRRAVPKLGTYADLLAVLALDLRGLHLADDVAERIAAQAIEIRRATDAIQLS